VLDRHGSKATLSINDKRSPRGRRIAPYWIQARRLIPTVFAQLRAGQPGSLIR
jgi:hypothetical protein